MLVHKNKNIKLGVDFDGVIASMPIYICKMIRQKFSIPASVNQIREYSIEKCFNLSTAQTQEIFTELQTPKACYDIKPYPDAIEVLQKWYEFTGKSLQIITSRSEEELLHLFFQKHMPDVCVCIYSASPKTTIAKKLGITHFIDDHPQNLADIASAGIQPIRFAQPYNKLSSRSLLNKLCVHVKNWKDISEYLFR